MLNTLIRAATDAESKSEFIKQVKMAYAQDHAVSSLMASALASISSPARVRAAQINGKKGGRPKKEVK